jgi:hypothetical protein
MAHTEEHRAPLPQRTKKQIDFLRGILGADHPEFKREEAEFLSPEPAAPSAPTPTAQLGTLFGLGYGGTPDAPVSPAPTALVRPAPSDADERAAATLKGRELRDEQQFAENQKNAKRLFAEADRLEANAELKKAQGVPGVIPELAGGRLRQQARHLELLGGRRPGMIGAAEAFQERAVEPAGAVVAEAATRALPGPEGAMERRGREARARGEGPLESITGAFQRTDFPTAQIDVTPGFRIPLGGGRYLDKVDVGLKGLAELVGTSPDLLLPGGVGALATGISSAGRALGRGATQAARVAAAQAATPPVSAAVPPPTAVTPPPAVAEVGRGPGLGARIQEFREGIRAQQPTPAPPPPGAAPPPPGAAPPPPGAAAPPSPTAPDLGKLPQAAAWALTRAARMVALDKPGVLSDVIERIPSLKNTIGRFQRAWRPAGTQADHLLTAHIAEGAAKAEVSQSMFSSEMPILRLIDEVFGSGTAAGIPSPRVRFLGTPAQADNILTGTIKDIADNPQLYDLDEAQKAALAQFDRRNTELLEKANAEYGTNIGHFAPNKGGAFLPNVDKSATAEEIAELLGGDISGAVRRGRTKTRIFQTARDRMAADPSFVPEMNVRLLLRALDNTKADMVGGEVFRAGVGGKTRVAVVEDLHPHLARRLSELRTRIKGIQGRLATAQRQSSVLGRQDDKLTRQLLELENRAVPMRARIAELGEEYGTELSFLSGQVYELQIAARGLTRQALGIGTRLTGRRAAQKTLLTELSELAPKLDKIQQGYKAANLKGWTLVEDGIFRYFPPAEAVTVKELRKVSDSTFWKFVESWRATVLGGDLSPLIGIQTPLGWLFDPYGVSRQWINGIRTGIDKGDIFRAFKAEPLADDVAADPGSWLPFAFHTGRASRAGTPEEFAGGLLNKIPGYTRANEAMYTTVLRQQKRLFDDTVSHMVAHGVDQLDAFVLAGDVATQVYPMINPRRLGQSQARATKARAMLTSVSFVRQPIVLTKEAFTAFLKVVARKPLTAREAMAFRLYSTFLASTFALSLSSNVLSAASRGLSITEAVKESIDPTNSKFMAIVFGSRRLPIGGPFRALLKAMWPSEVEGSPIPLPFAGLPNFFVNRLSPAFAAQRDLLRNRDFYGHKIRKGAAPEAIARMFAYEVESALPIAAGAVAEGIRQGAPASDILEESIAQFGGTNLAIETPFQARNADVERWSRSLGLKDVQSYYDLSPALRLAFDQAQPGSAEKIKTEVRRREKSGREDAQYSGRVLRANDEEAAAFDRIVQAIITREPNFNEVSAYFQARARTATLKEGAARDFNIEFDTVEPNEAPDNKQALAAYYDLFGQATEDTVFFVGKWWKLLEDFEMNLRRAPNGNERLAYILRNTNLVEVPPELFRRLPPKTRTSIRASREARAEHLKSLGVSPPFLTRTLQPYDGGMRLTDEAFPAALRSRQSILNPTMAGP